MEDVTRRFGSATSSAEDYIEVLRRLTDAGIVPPPMMP